MKRLSEEDKLEIWQRLERGESMRSIAQQLGNGSTAVRDVRRGVWGPAAGA